MSKQKSGLNKYLVYSLDCLNFDGMSKLQCLCKLLHIKMLLLGID